MQSAVCLRSTQCIPPPALSPPVFSLCLPAQAAEAEQAALCQRDGALALIGNLVLEDVPANSDEVGLRARGLGPAVAAINEGRQCHGLVPGGQLHACGCGAYVQDPDCTVLAIPGAIPSNHGNLHAQAHNQVLGEAGPPRRNVQGSEVGQS